MRVSFSFTCLAHWRSGGKYRARSLARERPTRVHRSESRFRPVTRAPPIRRQVRTVRTKGVATRIALTLADPPFPAEASNTPSRAGVGLAQRSFHPSSGDRYTVVSHPLPSLPPAQAPRLLCGLCPILIHIHVSMATYSRPAQRQFLVLPHRLAVFTDYGVEGDTDGPGIFLWCRTPAYNRPPAPRARNNCGDSLSLSAFHHSFLSEPASRRFLHAPDTCGYSRDTSFQRKLERAPTVDQRSLRGEFYIFRFFNFSRLKCIDGGCSLHGLPCDHREIRVQGVQ